MRMGRKQDNILLLETSCTTSKTSNKAERASLPYHHGRYGNLTTPQMCVLDGNNATWTTNTERETL